MNKTRRGRSILLTFRLPLCRLSPLSTYKHPYITAVSLLMQLCAVGDAQTELTLRSGASHPFLQFVVFLFFFLSLRLLQPTPASPLFRLSSHCRPRPSSLETLSTSPRVDFLVPPLFPLSWHSPSSPLSTLPSLSSSPLPSLLAVPSLLPAVPHLAILFPQAQLQFRGPILRSGKSRRKTAVVSLALLPLLPTLQYLHRQSCLTLLSLPSDLE
jgi:hypothetical protein